MNQRAHSETTHNISSEYNLWLEVLKLALDDALHGNELLRGQALAWLNSNADPVGSCRYICDLFNTDPVMLRNVLEQCAKQPKPKRRRQRVERVT